MDQLTYLAFTNMEETEGESIEYIVGPKYMARSLF
jgi:hypothetical protein